MTDKNKYVLAEIRRLRAEFAEADRMFCLAYDDEVRPDYNKHAAIYGKNAAMLGATSYAQSPQAGELEGKERDEIERLAFA